MKKTFILILLVGISFFTFAQGPSSCDKSSCGPGGTKTGEAKAITALRTDLQDVVIKMSKSSLAFDKQVSGMTIAQGANDDESLLFISQAVATIRYELLNKVQSDRLTADLRNYKPTSFTNKQQMVSTLKKEIDALADQAEKL